MKKRPVFLAIVTLIIGFVLGMLTSAQLRSHRLKPVRMFYAEDRFRDGIYQAIQPTDDQKVIIDKILDKYSRMNRDSYAAFRKEFEVRMEKFRTELDSNLSPDQITRLKELVAQMRKMIKQGRGDRGKERRGYRSGNKPDSLRNAPSGEQPSGLHPPAGDHAGDSSGSADRE